MDPSGNAIETSACGENNVHCFPVCSCVAGYSGNDCSLNALSAANRDASRSTMCSALLNATALQNPSAHLLESLASSLSQSYDPHQVTSPEGQIVCSRALQALSDMMAAGLLRKASPSAVTTIAQTISLFATANQAAISYNQSYSVSASGGRRSLRVMASSHTSTSVVSSTTSLQKSIVANMAGGEAKQSVVTSQVRISAVKELPSTMNSRPLSPPRTEAEHAYGVPAQQVILPRSGLAGCGGDHTAYSQIAMVQFGNNPYSNSSGVKSPLMRFSNSAPSKTMAAHPPPVDPRDNTDPYYIVMQYTQPQTTTVKPTSQSSPGSRPTPAPTAMTSPSKPHASVRWTRRLRNSLVAVGKMIGIGKEGSFSYSDLEDIRNATKLDIDTNNDVNKDINADFRRSMSAMPEISDLVGSSQYPMGSHKLLGTPSKAPTKAPVPRLPTRQPTPRPTARPTTRNPTRAPSAAPTTTAMLNNVSWSYPACMLRKGDAYVPCPCNVSSHTATNVTFICYDLTPICPPVPDNTKMKFQLNREARNRNLGSSDDSSSSSSSSSSTYFQVRMSSHANHSNISFHRKIP